MDALWKSKDVAPHSERYCIMHARSVLEAVGGSFAMKKDGESLRLEESLVESAQVLGKKHNLDPVTVLRHLVDLAFIRRGLENAARERVSLN